ncbi:MAG: hypothetical protein ACFFD4_36785, partial [Candidatus Odinarchaeota archaeon]
YLEKKEELVLLGWLFHFLELHQVNLYYGEFRRILVIQQPFSFLSGFLVFFNDPYQLISELARHGMVVITCLVLKRNLKQKQSR